MAYNFEFWKFFPLFDYFLYLLRSNRKATKELFPIEIEFAKNYINHVKHKFLSPHSLR